MYNGNITTRLIPENPASHWAVVMPFSERNIGEIFMKKKDRIKLNCVGCHTSFEVIPSKKDKKHCSRACYDKLKVNHVFEKCKTCNADFKAILSEIARGGAKYCSVTCYNKAKKIDLPEGILKICKIHGPLNESQSYKIKNKKATIGYYISCKQCSIDSQWKRGCPRHGFISKENRTADGRCKECHNNWGKRKREVDPDYFKERVNAKNLKSRTENPEKWAIFYKEKYKKQKEKMSIEELEKNNINIALKRYKMDSDTYSQMILSQNNKCKICGKLEDSLSKNGKIKRLSIDHCHKTGAIRGLLCHRCNVMLGNATDSTEILMLAIIYLQEHEEVNGKA